MPRRYFLMHRDGVRLDEPGRIDDFLSEAFSHDCEWLAVPRERLGDSFFVLSSRLLGQTAQKFRNYNVGLAVVGEVAVEQEASQSFRDFVRETNRGDALWFVADETALKEKLDA